MAPVDGNVALVTERGHHDLGAFRASVLQAPHTASLHRPPGVPGLLGQLGGLVLPVVRHASRLQRILVRLRVALLGRRKMMASTIWCDMAR
jgi:hypothetical protein